MKLSLDEALTLLETAPTVRDTLKKMLSGDFQNLKEAYFHGEEGTLEYASNLKKVLSLLDFQGAPKNSDSYKAFKEELRAAEVAKKAWQKLKMGKYL